MKQKYSKFGTPHSLDFKHNEMTNIALSLKTSFGWSPRVVRFKVMERLNGNLMFYFMYFTLTKTKVMSCMLPYASWYLWKDFYLWQIVPCEEQGSTNLWSLRQHLMKFKAAQVVIRWWSLWQHHVCCLDLHNLCCIKLHEVLPWASPPCAALFFTGYYLSKI